MEAATPEPIIAQVRRQLADDARLGATVPRGVRDRVAERTMRELWGSRVKTFVPVLALRQAREALEARKLVLAAEPSGAGSAERPPIAERPRAERAPRDVLHIADDVLPIDERDVLPL